MRRYLKPFHIKMLIKLTDSLIDPVGEVLLQREELPRLRVQNLLPVVVLVGSAGGLRRQCAVGALIAAAHAPHQRLSPPRATLLRPSLKSTPHVLERIGPLKRIEDPVEVPTERPLEGILIGRRRHRPGGAAADGRRSAAVVRHAGAGRAICNTTLWSLPTQDNVIAV